MQYTETELAKLIETVESEFTAHLSKAEALAKSEGEPPKKEAKPEEKKPEAEAKPAAEGAKPPEAAPAAPEAKPAAEGAAPAAAPAAPGAAPAADHGYDEEDMQHMDQMYASMSEPELKAHHDSIRKCLDAKGGAAQAAAPAAPAPAAPAANPMGKSEAGKSEISAENPVLNSKPKAGGKNLDSDPKNGGIEGAQPHDIPNRSEASKDSKNLKDAMEKAEAARRNGGKIEDSPPHNSPGAKSPASKADGNQMEKSEKEFDLLKSELEAEKAKAADLKKNFDAAQEFVSKLVSKLSGAPKGKAITEVAALQKSEGASEKIELSKVEITEKLFKKASDPKLEKADRDAINKFYDGGQIDIKQVSHLLK
jgi:hypothetical protein